MLDNFTLRDSATEACPGEYGDVKFHYSERANSLIEEAWARVPHITIYSPDFNPIEESISNRGIHFKDQGAVMSGEGAGPPEALECAGKSYPKYSK
jgi:hypothetical protein